MKQVQRRKEENTYTHLTYIESSLTINTLSTDNNSCDEDITRDLNSNDAASVTEEYNTSSRDPESGRDEKEPRH